MLSVWFAVRRVLVGAGCGAAIGFLLQYMVVRSPAANEPGVVAAFVGIVAWGISGLGRPTRLPLLYLGLAAVALGAAYHHWQREVFKTDPREIVPIF